MRVQGAQVPLKFCRAMRRLDSKEVPEESLRRYGLTFDQIVQAVRRSSLDLPGGTIKASRASPGTVCMTLTKAMLGPRSLS